MQYEEVEYKKSNREKAMTPKTGRYWCYGCDAYLVGNGEKCLVCKEINGHRTLKKETNA